MKNNEICYEKYNLRIDKELSDNMDQSETSHTHRVFALASNDAGINFAKHGASL